MSAVSSEAIVLKKLYTNAVQRRAAVVDWEYPDTDDIDEHEDRALDWYNAEGNHQLTFWEGYVVFSDSGAAAATAAPMAQLLDKGDIFNKASDDVSKMVAAFGVVLANTHFFARGLLQIPPTLFVVMSGSHSVPSEQLKDLSTTRSFGRACILTGGDAPMDVAWLVQERSTGDIYAYGGDVGANGDVSIGLFGALPTQRVGPGRMGSGNPATLMHTLKLSLMDDRRLTSALRADPEDSDPFGVAPSVRLVRSLAIAGISPWVRSGIEENDPVVPTGSMTKDTVSLVRGLVNGSA